MFRHELFDGCCGCVGHCACPIPAEEYEQRFAGIDLEGLRQRMSPEIFEAYVRFVGIIPGTPELDITELTRIPD